MVDAGVLVLGAGATILLSTMVWWWGAVPAFVIAHFFLFCNVVRMDRSLELVWAVSFLALAGATMLLGTPGWLVTGLVSLLVTTVVVALQLRKPSYHGVGWQRINPGLPAWWDAQR